MLVKDTVMKQDDFDAEDQIQVVLSRIPELKLGGVYIPLDDFPYFHDAQYGVLTQHTTDAGYTS